MLEVGRVVFQGSFGTVMSRNLFILVLLAGGFISGVANAQENGEVYKQDRVPTSLLQDRSKRMKLRNDINRVLAGRSPVNENFDKWYKFFILPRMTRYEPIADTVPNPLGQLSEWRYEFYQDLRIAAKNEVVHGRLNNLVFDYMSEVVKENYHPAVRYNAMLIIGDLNQRELVVSGGAKLLPVAWHEKLEFIVGEVISPDQIDAVRVAGLIGIKRHVELDSLSSGGSSIPEGMKPELASRLLQIVVAECPSDRSPDGHAWMQRQAIQILALLKSEDNQGAVTKELLAMISDEEHPLGLRCSATAALVQLASPEVLGQDSNDLTTKFTQLAIAACEQEAIRLGQGAAEETSEDNRISSQADSSDLSVVEISLKNLKWNLYASYVGFVGVDQKGGLRAVGDTGEVERIEKIVAVINAIMDNCSKPNSDPRRAIMDIHKGCQELKRLTAGQEIETPADASIDVDAADAAAAPENDAAEVDLEFSES